MSPGKQTSFFNCCAQVSFKKYVALTPDCLQMPRQLPQRDVVMMPVSFVVAVSVALTEALIRAPALVSTEVWTKLSRFSLFFDLSNGRSEVKKQAYAAFGLLSDMRSLVTSCPKIRCCIGGHACYASAVHLTSVHNLVTFMIFGDIWWVKLRTMQRLVFSQHLSFGKRTFALHFHIFLHLSTSSYCFITISQASPRRFCEQELADCWPQGSLIKRTHRNM